MIISVQLKEEQIKYIETCASIRNISRTRLMQRIVDRICEDQLVLAVLDDNSKPTHERYDRPFRELNDRSSDHGPVERPARRTAGA